MFPPLRRIVLPGTPMHEPLSPLVWIAGVPCIELVPSGTTNPDALPTVVFLHGNAMDLKSSWRPAWVMANQAKARVIVPEFRGYGIRGGSTDPYGTVTDVQRVIRKLKEVHLVGFSVGAAIAAQAAAGLRGVLSVSLVAPFYSLAKMVERATGPWTASLLLFQNDVFDTAKWLPLVRAPKLIVHGTDDQLIPAEDGRGLAELTSATFKAVEGAGHDNVSFESVHRWIRNRAR